MQDVCATHRAFAAMLTDGTVVTWGNPEYLDLKGKGLVESQMDCHEGATPLDIDIDINMISTIIMRGDRCWVTNVYIHVS